MESTQRIFHFYEEDGIVDIEAASYSEARRKYAEVKGNFPEPGMSVRAEPVR